MKLALVSQAEDGDRCCGCGQLGTDNEVTNVSMSDNAFCFCDTLKPAMLQTQQDHCDVRWTFTKCLLRLLLLLKQSLDISVQQYKELVKNSEQTCRPKGGQDHVAPPMSPDTLSFSQQKVILTAVQFVVCLGLCPSLKPGVGTPVDQRSEFGQYIVTGSMSLSNSVRLQRLVTCVKILLECIRQPTLGNIILSRHLADVLAALLQLCYGGTHAPESVKSTDNASAVSKNQESSQDLSLEEKTFVREQLGQLIQNVYQPMLVRELLILQGSPGSRGSIQVRSWKWMLHSSVDIHVFFLNSRENNILNLWISKLCCYKNPNVAFA